MWHLIKKTGCIDDELPRMKRGMKTLLPSELDDKVVSMVKNMRVCGTVISRNLVAAVGKGIVLANDRTLLKENGGHIELSDTWSRSILRRLQYVPRKGTTCKLPIAPGLLREVGFSFHSSIASLVSAHTIPPQLIINIDQTPLNFFLTSSHTLAPKGSKNDEW